jgi:hypothetical protein
MRYPNLFNDPDPRADMLPCITLWRPWANWVAGGHKTTETRLHERFESLQLRRIGIIAGQHWDEDAFDAARPYCACDPRNLCGGYHPTGLLCTVDVGAHRELSDDDSPHALIDCGTVKRVGFRLTAVRKFSDPIPIRGAQGIKYVSLSTAEKRMEVAGTGGGK